MAIVGNLKSSSGILVAVDTVGGSAKWVKGQLCMFFFLTEKFLSAPGLSSYLFLVMVQPLSLVIMQSFLHLIPH